jgi:hypothetical protein
MVPCDTSFLLVLAIPFILIGLFFAIKPELFVKYQTWTMKFFGAGTWKPNTRITIFYRIFGAVFLILGLIFLGMALFNPSVLNNAIVEENGNSFCSPLLQEFDNLVKRSRLPVIEDNNSLCHNPDAWDKLEYFAVGKLMEIKDWQSGHYTLIFQGKGTTAGLYNSSNYSEVSKYQIGKYYRINMYNICRGMAMIASSQSEPNIYFTKPEEVNCSKEVSISCNSNETCQNIDCSSHDKSGIKEGYKPYCVDNQCRCMCYGCH